MKKLLPSKGGRVWARVSVKVKVIVKVIKGGQWVVGWLGGSDGAILKAKRKIKSWKQKRALVRLFVGDSLKIITTIWIWWKKKTNYDYWGGVEWSASGITKKLSENFMET